LWNIERFYADPSRPDHINFLNSHGISTVKANNEIEKGIERHWELINTGRYQVFKANCPHTLDEYETYHYPEPGDLKPDQNQKKSINLPVDANNHAMDAERYITSHTYRIGSAKNVIEVNDKPMVKVKKADDCNVFDRINRLRKRNNAHLSI
jgi:hypothetical protein